MDAASSVVSLFFLDSRRLIASPCTGLQVERWEWASGSRFRPEAPAPAGKSWSSSQPGCPPLSGGSEPLIPKPARCMNRLGSQGMLPIAQVT